MCPTTHTCMFLHCERNVWKTRCGKSLSGLAISFIKSHFLYSEIDPSLYLHALLWVDLFCSLACHEQQMVIVLLGFDPACFFIPSPVWVWSQCVIVLPAGWYPCPSEPSASHWNAPGPRPQWVNLPSPSVGAQWAAEARVSGLAQRYRRWKRFRPPGRALQWTTARWKHMLLCKIRRSDREVENREDKLTSSISCIINKMCFWTTGIRKDRV